MKKQIFAWSMYDFADTIFSALFVTVYFPIFVVLKGGNAFHVGLVMSISMFFAGLLVPFLGALADVTQRKKLLLFIFTFLCCVFTFFAGFFSLTFVLILALLANFFYHAGLDVYDSMLIDISTRKNRGWISGLGTALGYGGTILSVAIAYFVGYFYGFESIPGIKLIFMITGLLFFGFSLFTFILLKEKSRIRIQKHHFVKAFKQVIYTIKHIKKFKSVWLFLLASFLYTDGANTAIIFLFLYARDQLALSLSQFLPIYVLMAVAAGLGSLLFGKLSDKLGHKRTLTIVLFLWSIIIFMLYFYTSYTTFLITGIAGGALLGAIWTITRPMMLTLAPKNKTAELMGYQGLTEKFSGVIGPVLFGYIAVAVGFNQALWVVIILFLTGAGVLRFVKYENT